MTPTLVLAVAAGGAAGSALRYVTMSAVGHWLGAGFPWGTLVVNALGSFVMGVLVEVWALTWTASPELRAFLAVGVLGGFTTFSTFSLDVVYLIERQQTTAAAGYVAASLALSVGFLFLGLMLMRQVLR